MLNFVCSSSGRISTVAAVLLLGGCASSPGWIPSTGPSQTQVGEAQDSRGITGIQVVDVTDSVARKLLSSNQSKLFSDAFPPTTAPGLVVNAGDVLEVTIWEAPPAMLFSSGVTTDARSGPSGARNTSLPEQMIGTDGTLNIPFAGLIHVIGLTPHQIEEAIANKLKGMANKPQVLVRTTRNNSANVTVVGEFASNVRMPLTSKGERLLDALAAAGGVRQPVSKITLQLTRGDTVQSLPLETVIKDPRQNIQLAPGDVVTSLYQPLSFTALGATGKNEEVNFEAQGISLAQALARSGGLQDNRADARGVFVFRFESPSALDWPNKPVAVTPDGKVPVVYRMDLKDPASFFVAQGFAIQNKDVVYVSNAPAAEMQKFLNILWSFTYSSLTILNATK